MTWLGDNNVNCGYLGASRTASLRKAPLSRAAVGITSVLYKSKVRNEGMRVGAGVCVYPLSFASHLTPTELVQLRREPRSQVL